MSLVALMDTVYILLGNSEFQIARGIMKTERLRAFGGFATDTLIPAVKDKDESKEKQVHSELVDVAIRTLMMIGICAILVTAGMIAWMGHDLQKSLRGKMSYLQCTKVLCLHFVNTEYATEYLKECLPTPPPSN